MLDFDGFLIAESVFPGVILGYVDCICNNCGCEYSSDYEEDKDEYQCPKCLTSNYPV